MANDELPVKEGKHCKMCFKSSKSLGHAWCSEGKGAVEVLDVRADEDKEMGDNIEELMEMHCMIPKKKDENSLFKIQIKERSEGMIIGGKCLKSMKSDPEVDGAMISDKDVEVALMVTETKEDSDEGFATVEEEEKEEDEESVDLSKGLCGQCPECNSKGPLGLLSSRCEEALTWV